MSQPPPPVPPAQTDELQFDTAEPAAPGEGVPAALNCAACNRPIADTYYAVGDKVVCPECREGIAASQTGGSPAARLLKAVVFGLGAGLAGAAIWWAVSRFLEMQIGLIAVLVGFMVGGAVRAGSDRRGGPGYQVLAVALTYLCIGISYAAQFLELFLMPEVRGEAPMAAVLRESLVRGLMEPFARGASGILGLLIIGFALWEAWQMNRSQPLDFNGPYRVAAPGGPTGAAPPQRPPATPGVGM